MKIEFGSIAMTVNVDSTRTKLTIVAHRPNAKDTLSAKSATNWLSINTSSIKASYQKVVGRQMRSKSVEP